LHHIADAFPPGFRSDVQNAVDEYITLVINDEWPLMKRGEESQAAHDTAYKVQALLVHYKPQTPVQQTLDARALDYAGQLLDARRNRILSNRQGIPIILWCTMLVLGVITIGFSFYFRVDRPMAQYIMVFALAMVIALTFSLIAELDFPFRGDIAIDPFAFEHVMRTLHGGVNAP
jgi:hypothetical protein